MMSRVPLLPFLPNYQIFIKLFIYKGSENLAMIGLGYEKEERNYENTEGL